jgi:hypothetical protein
MVAEFITLKLTEMLLNLAYIEPPVRGIKSLMWGEYRKGKLVKNIVENPGHSVDLLLTVLKMRNVEYIHIHFYDGSIETV